MRHPVWVGLPVGSVPPEQLDAAQDAARVSL